MLRDPTAPIKATLLGGALIWTVPSFVANTFSSLHASAEGATAGGGSEAKRRRMADDLRCAFREFGLIARHFWRIAAAFQGV